MSMFGAEGNVPAFPSPLEDNSMPYHARGLNQLQLFGNLAGGCNVGPINYVTNEQVAAMNPTMDQQKFHICLNNAHQNEGGRSGTLVNPNVVSTGLRLSYEEDEHNSSLAGTSKAMTAALPVLFSLGSSLKSEMDQQNEELDNYLKLQEQNILKGLREMKQKHTLSILSAVEKEMRRRLQEKELELENMNRMNKELTERIKKVAMDAQSWHLHAKYNESVVSILKNNLRQAMAQGSLQVKEGCGDSEVDDAISSANPGFAAPASASGFGMVGCRACQVREVRVLLLPCRHLCLCVECERFMDACPVCGVVKTVGVEVYMS